MTDTSYSIDGETYHDYDHVIDQVNSSYEPGESVEIYEGTEIKAKHSDFIIIDSLIENMQEIAYDNHGDFSEGYLCDIKKEKTEELEKLITDWFAENDGDPMFFQVINIKKITVISESTI